MTDQSSEPSEEFRTIELVCGRFVCPVVPVCDDLRSQCTSRSACDAAGRCLGCVEELGVVPALLARAREICAARAETLDVPRLAAHDGPEVSGALRPLAERPVDPELDALLGPLFSGVLLASELCEEDAAGERLLVGDEPTIPATATHVHGAWFSPGVLPFAKGDALRAVFMPCVRVVSRFTLPVRATAARQWQDAKGRYQAERFTDWQARHDRWLARYVQMEIVADTLPEGTRAPLVVVRGFDDDAHIDMGTTAHE